jgi:HEPN domain-containing protein
MNERPEQLHLVRQWIAKAEEDLKNAEHTLTLVEDCPFSTVCFHAQQCVEKYLKALLIFHALDFPRTHDVVKLFHILPAHNRPDIPLAALATLNRYVVETRYPGDWEPFDREEANDAVDIARDLRQKVRTVMSKELLG